MSALFTVSTDGSHLAPAADAGGERVLQALVNLRSLFGASLPEGVAAALPVPLALGTNPSDQAVPATLAMLPEVTGDLSPAGWRIGPGRDHAWARAQQAHAMIIDAAMIGYHGFDGMLAVHALGPFTLAASTVLPSGQRALSDSGFLRDLPALIADGIAQQCTQLTQVLGARAFSIVIREDAIDLVHTGTLRTPSGRTTYPPIPAARIGRAWGELIQQLRSGPESTITIEIGVSSDLLRAAHDAQAHTVAVTPAAMPAMAPGESSRLWEQLGSTRESGTGIALLIDPLDDPAAHIAKAGRAFSELGMSTAPLAGITIMARAGANRRSACDPAVFANGRDLLTNSHLEALASSVESWCGPWLE